MESGIGLGGYVAQVLPADFSMLHPCKGGIVAVHPAEKAGMGLSVNGVGIALQGRKAE